nr:DUF3304 domain-containing protein [Massilia sp. JS1662]
MKRSIRFCCAGTLIFVLGALVVYVGLFSGNVAVADSQNNSQATMTLDLVGYNYTNRHVEDYSIDTTNGGIVTVSTPTSGGSGSVCCVNLTPGESGTIFVRVRWQVDGCSYSEKDPITGNTEVLHHYLYKEEYVKVARPVGIKPNYLETHFYPNGTVQVQITEEMSLPRLKLSENRVEKLKFPKCNNEQRPEQ